MHHLTGQDLLSVTGSADTAAALRAHPVVVRNAVRFNAEADSLNCSVLGPDAIAGTREFDLYIAQLVTEMIVKAGQKCTAIRRALVPRGQLDAVTDAVTARLSEIRGRQSGPRRRGHGCAGQPRTARASAPCCCHADR
ncbi:aldehyde dehydrogenase family protein [Nocardia sp. GCM10030253]|uniref:aldehyde dehydrogenase family protein n=1 Tax=Nocardia sp. GCM10030253 TaxID=3273404 RepID=UPI00363ED754